MVVVDPVPPFLGLGDGVFRTLFLVGLVTLIFQRVLALFLMEGTDPRRPLFFLLRRCGHHRLFLKLSQILQFLVLGEFTNGK
jgi:hypothetical protein